MVVEQRIQEKTAPRQARVIPAPEPAVSPAPAPRPRRAMAHTGPRVLRRAKALQVNNSVLAAVLAATFTATMCCLYLFAYASVTAEGFELSRLRLKNKEASLKRDVLQAEISRLSLPRTGAQRAEALGMVKGTPETLVVVPEKDSPAAAPERPIR